MEILSERKINQGTFSLTEKVVDPVFPEKTVLGCQIQRSDLIFK